MSIGFGPDPVEQELTRVMALLDAGTFADDESSLVDLKEEAGRRDRQGTVRPGEPRNERAADQVAGEAACMANTPGGGALVLGAADDGTLIGTSLDVEWLRSRVYALTSNTLTIDVRPVVVQGARLLVIRAPQAIEPIRWRGRVSWRVDDRCVEIDPATWHAHRMDRMQFDWSAQPSTVPVSSVRETAVELARRFLRESRETHAIELAHQSTGELLRRLNVVTGDGLLTNAGVLAFVGRAEPAFDYIRREVAGGDARQRVREGGHSLLEELSDVFTRIEASNAIRHLPGQMSRGQVRDLPELAVREAVVNGAVHRDWGSPQPTVVEHVGSTLRVTSPGGFFGGVTAENILTHPSVSRNTALTALVAALRVAEREGVGVDRMVREMVRFGHETPLIDEVEGPYVRASLVGDIADGPWLEWLDAVQPRDAADDVNSLLLLRHLVQVGWVDVETAGPLLQLNRAETLGALQRLRNTTLSGVAIVSAVAGSPDGSSTAYALSDGGRAALQRLDDAVAWRRDWPTRRAIAASYSRARGRISTTELGSIVGASPSNVGSVLRELEESGVLEPSRVNRRGPGFFYRLVT